VKLESISQLGSGFFGLNLDNAPSQRIALFTQIHEIIFYGNGGYDWGTVYNMPIWLRKFTYVKIKEHYDKQAEQAQKSSKSDKKVTLVDPSGNINKEAFKQTAPVKPPTYQ